MPNHKGSMLTVNRQGMYVGLILSVALLISILLFWFKPAADKQPVHDAPPLAEYVIAEGEQLSIPVYSQGTIAPARQIKLIAEVSGRVSQVNPRAFNGEVFQRGDVLLQIDETDYRLALTQSEARVAAAEQQLERVEAEARQARFDLEQIGQDISKTSDYALKKPHVAEARANLRAARAELKLSRLKLARTRVEAPFDGRLVEHSVDVGQYVSVGTALAEIYSIESGEVRLPMSLTQIELLGLNLLTSEPQGKDVVVSLMAEYAGKPLQWNVALSHVESELDKRNRLATVVAALERSQMEGTESMPPLTPGMFVRAELKGRSREGVIRLPREVLRGVNSLWIVTEEEKLATRQVEIYAKDKNNIYVRSGINPGDRVIVNAIEYTIDGMRLTARHVSPPNREGEMK